MSYKFIYDKVGLNAELIRLKNQAEINWNKELRILKFLGLKDNFRVLEVGSGPGFYTKLLLDAFPNLEVYCLEINPTFINYAKHNLMEYSGRIHFVNESIEKTPFLDNSFDFVISRLVFQHLEKPYIAIKEIYRILKNNGKNIILDIDDELWGITYPYNELIYSTNKSMLNFQQSTGGDRNIGRKLIHLMKSVGFHSFDFDIIATNTDVVGIERFLGVNSREEAIRNTLNIDKDLSFYENKAKESHIDFLKKPYSSIILLMLAACGTK